MLKKGSLLCLAGCLAMFGLVACSDDDSGTCGDGVAEGSEQCDLTDLKQMTCADVVTGSSGTLACNLDCTYNTDGCALCGDGVRNFGEQCDCGTDAANLPTGCTDVNGGTNNANCSADCQKIAVCGDGTVDQGEECDCGTDAANLPTNCDDVNGGANANCDANCDAIVECNVDEWFGDCNSLTIGDCCEDEWGNQMECTTLSTDDYCLIPCTDNTECTYWGNLCRTDFGACLFEYCAEDSALGWPNRTMNAPCNMQNGSTGWCWPLFDREEPDELHVGLCVENGTGSHGDSCTAISVSGTDKNETTACNQGTCDAPTGSSTGVCKRFCDWEKIYDNKFYSAGVVDTLGPCPANSNCFTYAAIDLTTGLRGGDAGYCDDTAANGGYDTCSLVTGELLSSTNGTTCNSSTDYTNGVCQYLQFVDSNSNPVSLGTGSLVGVCGDGEAVSLNLWDVCDSTATTVGCPPQSICTNEDVFATTPSGTERCLPFCDTEHPDGAAQHCLDIFDTISTGSATTTCQSFSKISGGDGPLDEDPTRLGICAPLP